MDIDALAGALGVVPVQDAATVAASSADLPPLGAFSAQPVVPPPAAGDPSLALQGQPAPTSVAPSASGSAPASAVISTKTVVMALINDPTLSEPVKQQILQSGNAYAAQELDKTSFLKQLKELVGAQRIRQTMISLNAAPEASGAAAASCSSSHATPAVADRAPKRGAQQQRGDLPPPPAKRMRPDARSCADGYADASADAEAASAGAGAGGEARGTLDSQFDVLHQSGVDLAP